MNLINILSDLYNAVKTVIEFISTMTALITESIVILFTSFPSFISIGLGFVFGLGIFILVIKLIR